MAPNPELGQIMLEVDAGPESSPEEIDALTRQLHAEISQINVQSVELARSGETPDGAKFIDAIALGSLAVTLAPAVLPKLIELLQAWMLRGENRKLKLKTQVGDRAVEIEYSPKTTAPSELDRIVRMLQQGLGASSQPAPETPAAAVAPTPKSAPEPAPAIPAYAPTAPSAPTAKKYALIIGNSHYDDMKLARLVAPEADVRDLAAVLQDTSIGAFDEVKTISDAPLSTVQREIARFFAQRAPDDLLLLYFTGHGVRDDQGRLSLAVRDTDSTLLSGTALPASFITSEMDRSRSRRQILVLDCCHSGAFAQGAKGDAGLSVGTASAFEGNGFGRVVLTATDATQYAWEGDRVIGDAQNSVFTRYLVEGLRTGEADRSGNGAITVDELYDYVYEQVLKATPKQVPGKWSYRQQGDLVLARSRRPMRPADLPGELQQAIASPFSSVRGAAVQELARLLQSSSPGMALAARMALRKLSEDDSRKVASDAAQALAGAPPEPAPAPAAEVRPTATPIVVPVAVPGDAPPIESAAGVDLSALDGLTRAGAGSRSIETGNLAASMSYTPPTTASGPAATGISRTTTAISAGSIPVIAPRSNRPLLLTLLGGGGIVLGMVLCCAAVFAVNTLLPSTSTPRATTAVAAATNALAVVATATARPTAATLSTPVSIAAATSTPRVAPSPTAPPVADVAPDFTLLDGLGNSVRLSTVARQHRSVAVVFYHGYT